MGLFDVKKEQTAVKQSVSEVVRETELDRQLTELKKQQSDKIMRIGEVFIQQNTIETVKETDYEILLKEYLEGKAQIDVLNKRKLASQGLRKCENCENILPLDSVFCNKCGEKLSVLFQETDIHENICSQCGSPYETNATFCSVCGKKIEG